MGLRGPISKSSLNNYQSPNPDPRTFKVVEEAPYGNYLMAVIAYPGRTTYNGRKVMVFKGIRSLRGRETIDPHLLETEDAPIARFTGDVKGVMRAMMFMKMMDEEDD